eukprot:scaffold6090_cov129-Skeletonema_dohrnii-CCMP3373.AAC.2
MQCNSDKNNKQHEYEEIILMNKYCAADTDDLPIIVFVGAVVFKMSGNNIEADTSCCASCGMAEVDEIKLKECNCDLVKYCSDACQRNHKSYHEETCKKRAAELRDEILFKQPESNHLGDCPICCLPLSLDVQKSGMTACCSKMICKGCDYVNQIREVEASLDPACPFCRASLPEKGDYDKYRMKRLEANDPIAMRQEGIGKYYKGEHIKAFDYFTKAAKLGNAEAHNRLADLYHYGHGVEKDRGKEMYHLEEAAIGGHPNARRNLAWHEYHSGNTKKAVKHFIIAASQGHDLSIKALMEIFKEGYVSKDDLAAALRAHQAAVDATKSPQREAAEECDW